MDVKSAKMQPTRHWPPDCAYGDRKTLKTRLSKEKEEKGKGEDERRQDRGTGRRRWREPVSPNTCTEKSGRGMQGAVTTPASRGLGIHTGLQAGGWAALSCKRAQQSPHFLCTHRSGLSQGRESFRGPKCDWGLTSRDPLPVHLRGPRCTAAAVRAQGAFLARPASRPAGTDVLRPSLQVNPCCPRAGPLAP